MDRRSFLSCLGTVTLMPLGKVVEPLIRTNYTFHGPTTLGGMERCRSRFSNGPLPLGKRLDASWRVGEPLLKMPASLKYVSVDGVVYYRA